MKRAAARSLTLLFAALYAAVMALADGDWPTAVGTAQPEHYFGDVRPLATLKCYLYLPLKRFSHRSTALASCSALMSANV